MRRNAKQIVKPEIELRKQHSAVADISEFVIRDISELTVKEKMVLNQLNAGFSAFDIAYNLEISKSQVKEIIISIGNRAEPSGDGTKEAIAAYFYRLANNRYSINEIKYILKREKIENDIDSIRLINQAAYELKKSLDWNSLSVQAQKGFLSQLAFQLGFDVPGNTLKHIGLTKLCGEDHADGGPKLHEAPPGGQLYAQRADRKETAPAFIGRVYGGAGWLNGEFTRADLRKIDAAAVIGLENWERKNGRALVNLPTVKERNDRELAHPEVGQRARDGTRLRSALQRRTP